MGRKNWWMLSSSCPGRLPHKGKVGMQGFLIDFFTHEPSGLGSIIIVIDIGHMEISVQLESPTAPCTWSRYLHKSIVDQSTVEMLSTTRRHWDVVTAKIIPPSRHPPARSPS